MSWYRGYLAIAHVLFKNTEPKVENDCSSNFDPHVVRVGAHGVSPSKLIAKKKRIGHNLVPTYKIFAASSLCTSQNKLKSKEKKARTT